jgi:hypothetical protein
LLPLDTHHDDDVRSVSTLLSSSILRAPAQLTSSNSFIVNLLFIWSFLVSCALAQSLPLSFLIVSYYICMVEASYACCISDPTKKFGSAKCEGGVLLKWGVDADVQTHPTTCKCTLPIYECLQAGTKVAEAEVALKWRWCTTSCTSSNILIFLVIYILPLCFIKKRTYSLYFKL